MWRKAVSEVLVQFSELINDEEGRQYIARACGEEMPNDTRWHGWVEFTPIDGRPPIESGRETTQPNRKDAEYWATGLTPVYLEGALQRALHPLRIETRITRTTTIERVEEEVVETPAPGDLHR
jgi:hypothetical protein